MAAQQHLSLFLSLFSLLLADVIYLLLSFFLFVCVCVQRLTKNKKGWHTFWETDEPWKPIGECTHMDKLWTDSKLKSENGGAEGVAAGPGQRGIKYKDSCQMKSSENYMWLPSPTHSSLAPFSRVCVLKKWSGEVGPVDATRQVYNLPWLLFHDIAPQPTPQFVEFGFFVLFSRTNGRHNKSQQSVYGCEIKVWMYVFVLENKSSKKTCKVLK